MKLACGFVAIMFSGAVVAADPPKAVEYPSSAGQSTGDTVIIKSDAYGFKVVNAADDQQKAVKYCAGDDTLLRVNGRNETSTMVEFDKADIKQPAASGKVCPNGADMVFPGVAFVIDNQIYDSIRKKTNGVTFGGLVVPFKFRLGHGSKMVSSSTIAPYIGYRWTKLQFASLEMVPIASMGLAFVPVTDPATSKSDTKSAPSGALGFILTSEKNSSFNAGIIIGKDFMDHDFRKLDPSVSKKWLSIWLGVPIK